MVDDPAHILHGAHTLWIASLHWESSLPRRLWLLVGEPPSFLGLILRLPANSSFSDTIRTPSDSHLAELTTHSCLQKATQALGLTDFVEASGLELSGTAGVTLQQADDGGVTLGSFDELLQGQLTWKTRETSSSQRGDNQKHVWVMWNCRAGSSGYKTFHFYLISFFQFCMQHFCFYILNITLSMFYLFFFFIC